MLTINHTIVTPSCTMETILQVKSITCTMPSDYVDKNTFVNAGVCIIYPNDESIFFAYDGDNSDTQQKFYVMNEHGKTVATYSL